MQNNRPSPIFTWGKITVLSAPGIAFVGFYWSITVVFPSYFTQHFGMSLGMTATLLSVVRLWETLIAPLIGALSDATSSRFGRRKLWMVAATPGVMAATATIYFARPDLPAWCLVLAMVVLCTGWTMINVPHGAWSLEISARADERARIFGMRQFIGYGAMILFSLAPAISEQVWPVAGVAPHMIFAGSLILVTLPVSLVFLARRVPERPATPSRLSLRQVWRIYVLPLRGADFAPVAALFAAMGVYTAVEAALYLFLVRAGLGLGDWGMTLMLLQFACGLVSIPPWLAVHRRLGTVPTLRLIALLQVAGAIGLAFLPHGRLAPFIALAVLRGLVNGTEFILIRALLGRLLDSHAARNADVPAASYYASFHFLLDVAAAVTTFLVLHALAFTGFDPRAALPPSLDQAGRIQWLAALALSLPPAAMLVLLGRMEPRPRLRTSTHANKAAEPAR
ncbi:MFS transporter [Nitrospirillum iridis]